MPLVSFRPTQSGMGQSNTDATTGAKADQYRTSSKIMSKETPFRKPELLKVGDRGTIDGVSFGTITAVDPKNRGFPYTVLWEDSGYETLCMTQFTTASFLVKNAVP